MLNLIIIPPFILSHVEAWSGYGNLISDIVSLSSPISCWPFPGPPSWDTLVSLGYPVLQDLRITLSFYILCKLYNIPQLCALPLHNIIWNFTYLLLSLTCDISTLRPLSDLNPTPQKGIPSNLGISELYPLFLYWHQTLFLSWILFWILRTTPIPSLLEYM